MKVKRTENESREYRRPGPYTVAVEQEGFSPEGWANDSATPLTINGLARALLEPPLLLAPLLPQLDVSTNARHKPITSAKSRGCRGQRLEKALGKRLEMVSESEHLSSA